jgi:hypothetical protein
VTTGATLVWSDFLSPAKCQQLCQTYHKCGGFTHLRLAGSFSNQHVCVLKEQVCNVQRWCKRVANRDFRDFGWGIAHGAVTRRPPISLYTMVPRTQGYVRHWGLGFVHRSKAILCRAVQTKSRFATFFLIRCTAGEVRAAVRGSVGRAAGRHGRPARRLRGGGGGDAG